jgi:cation diffusion facilitator CzcD-associated flavoprotein CzcO
MKHLEERMTVTPVPAPEVTGPLPRPASALAASGPLPDSVGVVVVGSGFAGLATAIRLREQGRRDFVVLERAGDVGGTWRDNSYPGCACDVPSHLYSFSFAPNPEWTRSFSPQPEIQAYLQRTARERGVMPHVHLHTEVLSARWDDETTSWQVTTSRGTVTAPVLVVGAGALSEPSIPPLAGLDSFEGTRFHSASWDHGADLGGKRVAVIGTGASAIQFVPHVQREAARLTLFQRTAPWVMPRRDHPIGRVRRSVYRRVPMAQRLSRAGIYCGRETWVLGFTSARPIMRIAEHQARRLLARQVPDPVLREKLTPTFRLGCKRVLLSNDYYPALTQPNVEVVTDRIVEVKPSAVVTAGADGALTEHPTDAIVFGTGFRVTDQPMAERIVGRDGRSLAEHWEADGMSALHGVTVAGFPNLFYLVGPNTGLGHTSIVYMIESQVAYLLDALRQMKRRGLAAIEPRAQAQREENEQIQRDLEGTVWNTGGCASWYLDAQGRNTTLWPTFTFVYRRRLRSVDLSQYVLIERSHAAAVAA